MSRVFFNLTIISYLNSNLACNSVKTSWSEFTTYLGYKRLKRSVFVITCEDIQFKKELCYTLRNTANTNFDGAVLNQPFMGKKVI